jgi:hypothetical protein
MSENTCSHCYCQDMVDCGDEKAIEENEEYEWCDTTGDIKKNNKYYWGAVLLIVLFFVIMYILAK